MSTKAMPPIPPRPTRAADKHIISTGSTLSPEMPKIPPRPAHRRIERSQSPHRDSYAPSPLNEPSFMANQGSHGKPSSLYSNGSANASNTDLPRRPPSVTLPSLGQEGNEYAEVFGVTDETPSSPAQTRNVANDLHLHAPKPSLPVSSAKQRVSTVTRTDSNQAAALGIGKANSDDAEPQSRSLRSKSSFASQHSNTTERPPSGSDGEHGIPEIGQRVPMYPNAGDVQAPSPAPFATPYTPGIGFHNDGSKPRHHGRRTSGPPGSYGLHGHGVAPNDRFEKLYYEKHPELLKKETGHYSGAVGDGRGEWALSSDDLNKIVRETASRGTGLGTSPAVMSTPTEDIGFLASEEYTSRMSSPHPQPVEYHNKAHSNHSQSHVESPLRKQSFTSDAISKDDLQGPPATGHRPETSHESEVEDDDVVHIDPSERRASAVYSLSSQMESTESLGRHIGTPGEEGEFFNEHGYSAPILASDEVAKDPFGYELQPAVSPMQDRSIIEPLSQYRSSSASSSRPTSRPVSIHGGISGARFLQDFDRESHYTPLEDLDEYEPLFPEDEKKSGYGLKGKPLTAADKLKRPDLKNRKFPSQDIWEDAPNSLHYTATVSSPQLPEEKEDSSTMTALHPREGETPEQAFARRQEELAEQESLDSDSFLNREKKPWSHRADLDTRPLVKQRFPSRDIWESTPDSLQLTTTVSNPQLDEKDIVSPPEERPTTGAVVFHQEKAAAGRELGEEEGRATTGIAAVMKPQVPARPTKQKPIGVSSLLATSSPTEKSAAPPIPAKSKPQIPARPVRTVSKDGDTVPLTKVTSASSSKSIESDQGSTAPAAKAKPPVPSRPAGSKIAALQGGFMSDLNKRLQLGPQAPKKEEPAPEENVEEKEKAPLPDARKGRAKGPVRRAPAKSPAPATGVASAPSTTSTLVFSKPITLWNIDPEDGTIDVASEAEKLSTHNNSEASQSLAPPLATNTAGESLNGASDVAPSTEAPSASLPGATQDVHAQETEDHTEAALADKEPLFKPMSEQVPITSEKVEVPTAEDLPVSTGAIQHAVEAKEVEPMESVTAEPAKDKSESILVAEETGAPEEAGADAINTVATPVEKEEAQVSAEH